jgi:general stress protein CsbA
VKLIASCVAVICGALILASAAAWIVVITKWVLILAVVSAVVGVCVLAYTVFIKHKALTEIIAGVEKIKAAMVQVKGVEPPVAVADIPSILSDQSPTTKAVVSAIKAKL